MPRIRRGFLYAGAGALVLGIITLVRRRKAGSAPVVGGRTIALPSFATKELVTHAEADKHDGFVHVPPRELADRAGVGIETYTLARFLGSEYASGNAVEKAAIAWTIVNAAKRRGWSILRMATTVCKRSGGKTTCEDSGMFGKQDMPDGRNRFASTARDPSKADIYVASQVLGGAWPDVSSHGDQFFDVSTQIKLRKKSPGRYKSPEDLLKSWGVYPGGPKSIRVIPGVNPKNLTVIGARRDGEPQTLTA